MRSERREAIQRAIEAVLSLMDLNSLCLGTPAGKPGFIDVDLGTIVTRSGLSRRRCQRALADLVRAGFLTVKRRCAKNKEGDYFGLRSIRTVQACFFEYLNLSPMLARERKKAYVRLKENARRLGIDPADFFKRLAKKLDVKKIGSKRKSEPERRASFLWQQHLAGLMDNKKLSREEAERRTNEALGYPQGYHPSHQRAEGGKAGA